VTAIRALCFLRGVGKIKSLQNNYKNMEGEPKQEANPVLKGEILSWISNLDEIVDGLDDTELANLSVDIEELVKKYKK
jgi:hypothetical protein